MKLNKCPLCNHSVKLTQVDIEECGPFTTWNEIACSGCGLLTGFGIGNDEILKRIWNAPLEVRIEALKLRNKFGAYQLMEGVLNQHERSSKSQVIDNEGEY